MNSSERTIVFSPSKVLISFPSFLFHHIWLDDHHQADRRPFLRKRRDSWDYLRMAWHRMPMCGLPSLVDPLVKMDQRRRRFGGEVWGLQPFPRFPSLTVPSSSYTRL